MSRRKKNRPIIIITRRVDFFPDAQSVISAPRYFQQNQSGRMRCVHGKIFNSPDNICHQCVPAWAALNLYWNVVCGSIGHCVTIGAPSITGVSFCHWPLQCTETLWPGIRLTISITIISFSQTCNEFEI